MIYIIYLYILLYSDRNYKIYIIIINNMGIERFFSSIEENNITNLGTSFKIKLDKNINTESLFIDFNSIIYINSFIVINDLNYILYNIIINNKNTEKFKNIIEEYELKLDNINYKEYNKLINEQIDNIIIQKVREYIYNMLINFIEPDKLKLLYIAIDSVPSKSKMIEQKKRRYLGGIINEIKNQIYLKYKDDLKNDNNRYLYEQYKIEWNRNKISPGTEFMDKIDNLFNSIEFEVSIKDICNNLEKYIYNGVYEYGEGEKKIVDYLRNNYNKLNSHIIYSPDSDMTILCMLLNSNLTEKYKKINNIKIMRYNQQKSIYDIINIDQLNENLYKYLKTKTTKKIDKDNYIKDIVLLLTIFGNDFLPKIESLNVVYDFNLIIDKYIKILIENKSDNTLVEYNKNNNKLEINQSMLIRIFKELQYDEGNNLQKIYMVSHYSNYNKLKELLEVNDNDFTDKMTEFLGKLSKFNEDIRNTDKQDINKLINKWKNDIFIKKLQKFTNLPKTNNDEYIKNFYEYYLLNNNLPKIRIIFRKYLKSLEEEHHQKKLRKNIDKIDTSLDITEYDKEIYKFDNMLDEYIYKLNSTALNIGHVYIDPKTYTWKTEKITNGVVRYYKNFFGIDNINVDNKKLIKLVDKYIEGFLWVFNFYYNDFNIKDNHMYANIWYYPYHHAPLLTQIYNYLVQQDTKYINNKLYDINKYTISRDKYFNCIEHLLYVSPAPLIKDIIPSEYYKFIDKYYPNFDELIKELMEGSTNLIDCKGSLFLTKCNLNIKNFIFNTEEDNEFITNLRKIKFNNDKLKCIFSENINIKEYNYGKIIKLNELKK